MRRIPHEWRGKINSERDLFPFRGRYRYFNTKLSESTLLRGKKKNTEWGLSINKKNIVLGDLKTPKSSNQNILPP